MIYEGENMSNRVLSTEVLAIIVQHGALNYNDKESNFGLLSSPKMSILDSFQALHMGKAAMNRNLIIFPIDVALLLH